MFASAPTTEGATSFAAFAKGGRHIASSAAVPKNSVPGCNDQKPVPGGTTDKSPEPALSEVERTKVLGKSKTRTTLRRAPER